MRWRFRSRGAVYTILLVLAVWLLSINYTIVPKVYHRSAARSFSQYADISSLFREDANPDISITADIVHQIVDIAKSIHRAKVHVRGTKTSDALRKALKSMDTVLEALNINRTNLFTRKVKSPTNVCPEKYMGSTFGYPFFYRGFEVTDCSYKKPLSRLVTILAYLKNENAATIRKRLHSFSKFSKENGNISILIAVKSKVLLKEKIHEQIRIVFNNKNQSDGVVWNNMVSETHTPYVLLARDVDILTDDARLERLVREIETQQVPVAAGAIRYQNGHWVKGCYQSVHKNFTLRYQEGYDESFHECIFCDYSLGPFVTAVKTIKSFQFSSYSGSTLFEDWFLRLKNKNLETIVCPDSMYHVVPDNNKESIDQFMVDWMLYKTVSPIGEVTYTNCTKLPGKANERALSPCLLNNNAVAVNTVMKTCAQNNIVCELQEGTSLGAVKLGKVLPWERDADITFLSANYSKFQELSDAFESKGFAFKDLGAQWCCVDNRTAGGKFYLGYPGWSIEMYGQHIMDSEVLLEKGMKPTQVLHHGVWVNVARNPGLFVRNRYGHEIYQHATHWFTTKSKSGWDPYKTNIFPTCDIQGNHDCLDRYNADGDLPFSEPVP